MKIYDGGGVVDEQENIEVLEIFFDEVFKMIKIGDIKDVKMVFLFQYLKFC